MALESFDELPPDQAARVTVGAISLEVPATLVPSGGTPVDSVSAVFEGTGVIVIVDQGPFADRLQTAPGRPEYREAPTEVAGATGRSIYFRSPEDKTFTVATVLSAPTAVTVVVRAAETVPAEVAQRIVASVQLVGSNVSEEGSSDE